MLRLNEDQHIQATILERVFSPNIHDRYIYLYLLKVPKSGLNFLFISTSTHQLQPFTLPTLAEGNHDLKAYLYRYSIFGYLQLTLYYLLLLINHHRPKLVLMIAYRPKWLKYFWVIIEDGDSQSLRIMILQDLSCFPSHFQWYTWWVP